MHAITTAYQYRALTRKPASRPISGAGWAVLVIIASAAIGTACNIISFCN